MFGGTGGPRLSSINSSESRGDPDEDPGQYPGMGYRSNNDYINLARDFINPSTNVAFDKYLAQCDLTPKARLKLKNFYELTIHPLLVSGNIPSPEDEHKLIGIFNVAMAELPLELTTFDINSEFNQVLTLVRLHFINQLQKARKGQTFNRLTTTNRQEVYNLDGNVEPARRNFLSNLNFFGRN